MKKLLNYKLLTEVPVLPHKPLRKSCKPWLSFPKSLNTNQRNRKHHVHPIPKLVAHKNLKNAMNRRHYASETRHVTWGSLSSAWLLL